MNYEKPDQWVDWGGHTVTVDPVRTTQWISDSHDRHQASIMRGRAYDARDVRHLQDWEQRVPPISIEYFEPTSDMIAKNTRWPTCPEWYDLHNVNGKDRGEAPIIEQLRYDNKLINKSIGDIETESREFERRAAHRLFDKM
ncbi:hypothetical protein [Pleurochrysis sp. endemic virus 2]|nr:hypothetical protein [Pleurochrysis sp. endemic virus 2]